MDKRLRGVISGGLGPNIFDIFVKDGLKEGDERVGINIFRFDESGVVH